MERLRQHFVGYVESEQDRLMTLGFTSADLTTLKAKPMLAHDYTPLFRLEHMLKDVGICLDESAAAGAPFPSAALARELYHAAMGRGLADEDFAAVLEAVEGMAGLRL